MRIWGITDLKKKFFMLGIKSDFWKNIFLIHLKVSLDS